MCAGAGRGLPGVLADPVKDPAARTRACVKRPAAEETEQYPGGRQLRMKDWGLACPRGRKLSGSQLGSLRGSRHPGSVAPGPGARSTSVAVQPRFPRGPATIPLHRPLPLTSSSEVGCQGMNCFRDRRFQTLLPFFKLCESKDSFFMVDMDCHIHTYTFALFLW